MSSASTSGVGGSNEGAQKGRGVGAKAASAPAGRCSGRTLGYVFIGLVCMIWLGSSFLVADLEKHGISPVMLSFISSSAFVVLVPWRARAIARGTRAALAAARGRDVRAMRGGTGKAVHAFDKGAVNAERRSGAPSGGTVSGPSGSWLASRKQRGFSSVGGDIEMVPLTSLEAQDLADERGSERSVPAGAAASSSAAQDGEAKRRPNVATAVEMYTFGHHFKAALLTAPLWVLGQLTFDYSLLLTTVTANSMLSSANVVFTFIISVYFRLDKFTWLKVLAISAYVVGTVLVTIADKKDEVDEHVVAGGSDGHETLTHKMMPMVGNLLALCFAACYALYTAVMKLYLKDDERTDMTLFLALMGIVNFVVFGIIIAVTRACGGFGNLYFALTRTVFAVAFVKALFDNVLNDYLWARAVLLTSPTIAAIGLSLQIPLAATIEVIIGSPPWAESMRTAMLMSSGMMFVLFGFGGVIFSPTPRDHHHLPTTTTSATKTSASLSKNGVVGVKPQSKRAVI